jgi:hypothetical protein
MALLVKVFGVTFGLTSKFLLALLYGARMTWTKGVGLNTSLHKVKHCVTRTAGVAYFLACLSVSATVNDCIYSGGL